MSEQQLLEAPGGEMSVKTYDPAAYDLAEHFLQDEPCRNDPELYKKHCHSLALEIQQAVEDWFFTPDEQPSPAIRGGE